MRALRSKLTYPHVVATLALILALGAGAYAGSRNSVGSKEIKKEAVRSSEVKDESLKERDVKDDALEGVDIDESSLGEVPLADIAGSAGFAATAAQLNGLSVVPLRWAAEQGAGATFEAVNTFGRADIEARCLENVVPFQTRTEVRITSDEQGADVHGFVALEGNAPTSFSKVNMDADTPYSVITAVDESGPSVAQAHLVWQIGQGINDVMTFDLLIVADEAASAIDCVVAGLITGATVP